MINAQITSKSKQNLGIHVFESHDALVSFCGDDYSYKIVDTKHRGWVNTLCLDEVRRYHVDAHNRQKPVLIN